MKKITIDVDSIMNTMSKAITDLKEGMPTAKLSKKAKKEIKEDLEEVIAMAEMLKKRNSAL